MAFDPWAQTNQGLSNLTNTLGTLAQLKRQDQQYAEEKPLRALQTQQAQQSVDQGKLTLASLKGQQDALVGEYGTATHTDPLGSAMTFQAQEKKMQDQQKQMMEKQKYAFDEFTKVSKAVKDGLISEDEASSFYHAGLRMSGIDLDKAGVKMSFKKQGGYFSGPITPDALFMVNGKPTPYGGNGTIEKARVVGRDEATGKPIFEMDENTKFEVAKAEPAGKPFDRKYNDGDTEVTELYDASGKLTGTKKAPRYKPAAPATDKTDPIVAREAVKDLPKLRREARTAEATKPRITQMVQLLDAGNAGGLKGNALASVSGIFDIPATSEAELFKKLASAGAGQLRASVIGPGQVSNYEQTLLQSVSGGGSGARTAIRQLLKYYEQEADRTISNYNDAVDSAATVAPKVVKGFGKIGASKGGGGTKKPLSAY